MMLGWCDSNDQHHKSLVGGEVWEEVCEIVERTGCKRTNF